MTYLTFKLAWLSLHLLTVSFLKCFLCTCSKTCNGFCFYVEYHVVLILWHCTAFPALYFFCTSELANTSTALESVIWKIFFLPFSLTISSWRCRVNCGLHLIFFLLPFYSWSLGGLWVISEITVDLRPLKEVLFRGQVLQNVAFPSLFSLSQRDWFFPLKLRYKFAVLKSLFVCGWPFSVMMRGKQHALSAMLFPNVSSSTFATKLTRVVFPVCSGLN